MSSYLGKDSKSMHIVVSGAGPAGLMLCARLLHRNEKQGLKHRITLVDGRPDFGKIDFTKEKDLHRSWSMFMNEMGVDAMEEVPGFYESLSDAISPIGSFAIHMGKKELFSVSSKEANACQLLVERNRLVGCMSKFIHEKYGDQPEFNSRFETKLMYVDYDRKRVLLRSDGEDEYVSYDLLVGCDGLRSVVRETFVKKHPEFTFDLEDTLDRVKSAVVERPASIKPGSLHILGTPVKGMQGYVFPVTGDRICLAIGGPATSFAKFPKEVFSSDVKEVADFFRKNFKPFPLVDYEDFAKKWINQSWGRTMQNHCSVYHSIETSSVLMGDAAHATSPSLGMGMNNGLRDAQVFVKLMDKYHDDLDQVLPEYSQLRVKEGHALTNLSQHLTCLDAQVNNWSNMTMYMRAVGNFMMPRLIKPHPRFVVGSNPRAQLADSYQLAKDIGMLQKHGKINKKMQQDYLEEMIGLSAPRKSRNRFWRSRRISHASAQRSAQSCENLGLGLLQSN